MRNKHLFLLILISLFSFSFSSFYTAPKPKKIFFPSNFPKPTYNLKENPITDDGFELGRDLFYDELLSKNNTISCATCHQQTSAFIQADHDLSHGIEDRIGNRNALPIFNSIYKKSFFWDGGVPKLDFVAINPIENELEMDEKMDNVVKKINSSSNYKIKFKKAFNVDTISSQHILQALAQFMNAMISANSKYDKMIRKEGVEFNKDEISGMQIFTQKCGSCHPAPLFTDDTYKNNGLSGNVVEDLGRENITLNPKDRAAFKVPSLRNVFLTAPYMHDGRFNTLNEVLDHYSNGILKSNTLDPIFTKDSQIGISLSDVEKKQILLFLATLTDSVLISDTQFSKPIKNSN